MTIFAAMANNPPRIWLQFKALADWQALPTSRTNCRNKCGICKDKWGATGTAFVNYMVNRQGRPVYLCDKCAQNLIHGTTTEEENPAQPGADASHTCPG